MATNKWNKNSKDAQELRRMFENNEIAPCAQPKQILDSKPNWKAKYTTDQFRYAFKQTEERSVWKTRCRANEYN